MTSVPEKKASGSDWFVGGGEMGERIRSFDWSRTSIGPIETWPQSLRSAVSILLPSRAQIVLFWGSDLIALYNDAYGPVFGIKQPWALGSRARECWSEIWDVLGPLFEGVLRTGEAFWAEDHPFYMERHGYLEETYFNVSYDPVRDETGNVGGIFCIVAETTSRVLGDRRLRTLRDLSACASEARSAQDACANAAQILHQNTADVPFALIYLLDPEAKATRLAAVSNLDQRTSAIPQQIDLSEKPSEQLWPFAAIVETGQPIVVADLIERFGPLPGGPWPEPAAAALVLPLVTPGPKQITGFLVAGVNPRRALDEQYRDFFNLIAGHVATAIANARAHEEERKRAEALAELDRAKTAFFSNVSHEFRTPLTLILGPMEDMLADTGTPPAVRERLEVSHRNSLRLQKLVNSLLDFSRIEAGRIQASYEPTALGALTVDLASVFHSAIERAGMRLIVYCERLIEPVYVDREMWEKIVLNLISNAFKYTFEGEIVVTLRQLHHAVELSVRDTGIGIPEFELPRLFERFYRVEGARGRTHEGTGIGLALVQELVKLHGGSINVASVHGRGTTFTVILPLGTAHLPSEKIRTGATLASTAVASAVYRDEVLHWLSDDTPQNRDLWLSPADGAPASEALPVGTRGARVILADDNADMRDYVRRLLAPYYNVEVVTDGEAALAAARRAKPDLIITDIMMPRMDGFHLLGAIREDETLKTVPVIMLSARAGEEARVEGVMAGADDYLIKPFSARELLARVGAQLQLARLRREAEQTLRESEERHRRLLGLLPIAVYTCAAPSGIITFYNDHAVKLWGRAPSVGDSDERFCGSFKLWWPDGKALPHDQTPMAVALREGREFRNQEVVIERLDGTRITVLVHIDPIRDEDGRVVGAINAFHDTSALKQAEAALRESEERFRLVARAANDVIWEIDLNKNRVWWSEAMKRVFGYAPEEIGLETSWYYEHMHPDDRDRVVKGIADVIESEAQVCRMNSAIAGRMAATPT